MRLLAYVGVVFLAGTLLLIVVLFAREAPWFMMRLAGQAQYRRYRLKSNVRPNVTQPAAAE